MAQIFKLIRPESSQGCFNFVLDKTFLVARWEFYDDIQNKTKQAGNKGIKASMRLISAHQDNENFEGGCKDFCDAIGDHLQSQYARALKGRIKAERDEMIIQKPNYNREGPAGRGFDKKQPFSI